MWMNWCANIRVCECVCVCVCVLFLLCDRAREFLVSAANNLFLFAYCVISFRMLHFTLFLLQWQWEREQKKNVHYIVETHIQQTTTAKWKKNSMHLNKTRFRDCHETVYSHLLLLHEIRHYFNFLCLNIQILRSTRTNLNVIVHELIDVNENNIATIRHHLSSFTAIILFVLCLFFAVICQL